MPSLRIDSLVEVGSPSLSQRPWSAYPHDPAEAREVLESLCAELGRDCEQEPPRLVIMTTEWPDRVAAVDRMISDLAEIGVVVEPYYVPGLWPAILNDPWEAALFQWDLEPGLASVAQVLTTADPDSSPHEGGENWYHWGTPAVSGQVDDPHTFENEANYNQGPSSASGPAVERYRELAQAMRSTNDPAQLQQAILEAEQILADELVLIPLYRRPLLFVWNSAIGGYAHAVEGVANTWNIAEWYRTDL